MSKLQKNALYEDVKRILEAARNTVYRSVNFTMVTAYWEIGKKIVESDQNGELRAAYGKSVIKELSVQLTSDFGKGFDESNLRHFRLFYNTFQISDALRPELSWTHYRNKCEIFSVKRKQTNFCI